ncbi:MAG: ParB/RepB/Spo0J family partition protein, partial [Deferribacteraceae bacterium]|jgi:ParB family chromosome partitioning protein|nr:ParB/RepB/Spo0J family partition protein [Deferribacteraceae bacterium]
MLIAGERRWRAAGLAGLRTVPAVVIPHPEENERLELALIENTQRDDLKPMELARAYSALMIRCAYKQEELAKVAGKSRSAVANTLRLLDLEPIVMDALESKQLTEGHARVFLTLDKGLISELLNAVIQRGLSVRQTEALAKMLATEPKKAVAADPNIEALTKEFESFFGSKVSMKGKKGKDSGVIEIKYSSAEELDKIVNKLRGETC